MSTKKRLVQGLAAVLVGGGVLLAAPSAAMAVPEGPLTAPNNLHAVSITDLDIVLAWDASTAKKGGVTYNLFFDNNATPFLVGDNQFDVPFHRVIGMIPGSTHTFQVQAQDSSGQTAFGNTLTVSFAPGDNTPPTTPSNLRAVSMTADGMELAWGSIHRRVSLHLQHCFSGRLPDLRGTAPHHTGPDIPSIDLDPVCGIIPGFTVTFAIFARDAFDNESGVSTLTVMYTPQG